MRWCLASVLLLVSACAAVETHLDLNNASACVSRNCSDETNTARYNECAAACHKQYGQ
jgi:hypothetical protein